MALPNTKASILSEQWLQRRLPRAKSTTLNRQRIFILPSKTTLGVLILILVLFLLGINFQNTLVYAVCAWLAALVLISIFHTYRNLSGLTLTALHIEPCFSGERAVLALSLTHHSSAAKIALELEWRGQDRVQVNLTQGIAQTVALSHATSQRGWFQPPRLRISTRYPTGLAVAWSLVAFDCRGLVYPAPMAQLPRAALTNQGEITADGADLTLGTTDFGGIREYQAGDTPSHLHWGKYAQTGKLHTKTFIDPVSHELWLEWQAAPFADNEQRLSYLCRRVLDLQAADHRYGLKLPTTTIAPNKGEAHKAQCLQALALYALPKASHA